MEKIRVAIVGYGNIGSSILEAIEASNDMECAGIISRNPQRLTNNLELSKYIISTNVDELGKIDVAILSAPSRQVPDIAAEYLAKGINTVDSFDIHTSILDLRKKLSPIAKQNNAVSIISAGWDPGSDSVVRALMQAMAPKGLTYTNFGPGRSMGHSVVVKNMEGVKDALSMTIPLGTGIHRRMVYVELEEGTDFKEIEAKVKNDAYFIHDETHVIQVDSINDINNVAHGVNLVRRGVSGKTHNQIFEFDMSINNPALTAQILVGAARAAMLQRPGCYTMIEIPVIDFLEGSNNEASRDLIIKNLV